MRSPSVRRVTAAIASSSPNGIVVIGRPRPRSRASASGSGSGRAQASPVARSAGGASPSVAARWSSARLRSPRACERPTPGRGAAPGGVGRRGRRRSRLPQLDRRERGRCQEHEQPPPRRTAARRPTRLPCRRRVPSARDRRGFAPRPAAGSRAAGSRTVTPPMETVRFAHASERQARRPSASRSNGPGSAASSRNASPKYTSRSAAAAGPARASAARR